MRTPLRPLVLATALLALPAAAQAACFVEYKAKQDSPLRLHYGILRLDGACPDPAGATDAAAARLAAGGWTLLNVVGLSEDEPSDTQKANAGAFHLRF